MVSIDEITEKMSELSSAEKIDFLVTIVKQQMEKLENLAGMKYGPFEQQECCFCLFPLALSLRC